MEDEKPPLQPAGVGLEDHTESEGMPDPEKEMLRHQQHLDSETPDSGTTLDVPADAGEEKETPGSIPIADSSSDEHPRPTLHERTTTFASATSATRSLPRLKRKETRMMQKGGWYLSGSKSHSRCFPAAFRCEDLERLT
jgi:hypothetical protein